MENPREQVERAIMKELEKFDTPTIANVIAAYPKDQILCMGLYHPHKTNWYTDQKVRCLFPQMEPRCGYAVTAVYGVEDASYTRLGFEDILMAVERVHRPVILALKADITEEIREKNALIGGNMMTAFKQVGVVGVLGDGPARDVNEMRLLGVQCMFTGTTAGHGTTSVQAVEVPVSISGMDIAPGEVIHMDENGAVKFPAAYLETVLERAMLMRENDERKKAALKQTRDPRELASIMKGLY
ncbi:MAG: RraA family protein [Lachnospiraceae bacterium]|nr:RraA family protein [Lachnospiraceae bacterium]